MACSQFRATMLRDDDDDDDDDDLLVGLARPQLNATAAPMAEEEEDEEDEEDEEVAVGGAKPGDGSAGKDDDDDDDDDGDEPEGEGGLVGAEAAFALETAPDALELDPFRVARGVDVAVPGEASTSGKAAASKRGAPISRQIFVASLPPTANDAQLVKFFARYGKVQEAKVVKGAGGASRGFGFVTFVSDKGARFCLKEAGDPPTVTIDGRDCAVRYAEAKDDHGARQHKMPARGNIDYLGLNAKKRNASGLDGAPGGSGTTRDEELQAPGVSMIAAAHKRALPPNAAPGAVGAKRPKEQQEKGIVTVSRRQDAEPLNTQPITMREIFPKEFWRI